MKFMNYMNYMNYIILPKKFDVIHVIHVVHVVHVIHEFHEKRKFFSHFFLIKKSWNSWITCNSWITWNSWNLFFRENRVIHVIHLAHAIRVITYMHRMSFFCILWQILWQNMHMYKVCFLFFSACTYAQNIFHFAYFIFVTKICMTTRSTFCKKTYILSSYNSRNCSKISGKNVFFRFFLDQTH